MTILRPQFVTDSDGKRLSVLLPITEYTALMERLEDLEDLEDARKVRDEPMIPWETVKTELGIE